MKHRQLPQTPVIPPRDYKQNSLIEIDRFLVNPSFNTLKHNTYVIEYRRDEIDWDTFISPVLKRKDQKKPPRIRKGPLRNSHYSQKAFQQN